MMREPSPRITTRATLEAGAMTAQTDRADYEAAIAIWSGRADPDANVSIWLQCDGFIK